MKLLIKSDWRGIFEAYLIDFQQKSISLTDCPTSLADKFIRPDNRIEAVQASIEAGANVNAQGENGITTLMLASSEEIGADPKIKEMLIKAGAK